MRALRITLYLLFALALGCRVNSGQVLLEQESRMQEDRIFELEAMLDDCHAARESTIRENDALKKELAAGDRGPGADFEGPARSSGGISAPSIELPPAASEPPRRSRRDEAPKLEAPTIELPEPTDAPPPTTERMPGDEEAAIAEGEPTQLVINKRLTGGLDRDGEGGDEGILVVVEPRDSSGQLVKSPGAVSVVVMDPTQEGAATRVARWDFEPGEVPGHFHDNALGRGLQFELPWPSDPPRSRDLRLFVRFTTIAGRKMVVETPIDVRIASDPPRNDRQAASRSAAQSASRPAERIPSSRLRSPSNSNAPRADRAPRSDGEDKSAPAWDSDRSPRQPPDDEHERQAARPDRPEWKPYR